jgi:hypothetical protein
MRPNRRAETEAETKTLLTMTLACYLAAFASILIVSYTLAWLTAADLGRQVSALVGAPYGL